jgi:poly-gamma-glutamate capsule biosynthesis protein CapA/YwtB (metallophosphatase superfamily)
MELKLFFAGDCMFGRGIDQILPFKSDPVLYEEWVTDARDYVELAERKNGPIPRNVPYGYVWGDALGEFAKARPDLRIINLETSITTSPSAWPGKGINYRMHPSNTPLLTAASIDCCVLANNHVMDWGIDGLSETIDSLNASGVQWAGAGSDRHRAFSPAVLKVNEMTRVLVFSFGDRSSGIPPSWAAQEQTPGVAFLDSYSDETVARIRECVLSVQQPGDITVGSIHWGGNWDFQIPPSMRQFAHDLIDYAGIDIVHGHSSHHVKDIEVYNGHCILYGCGDFINDYEGIDISYLGSGYRGDLSCMYFLTVDAVNGSLMKAELVPTTMRRFSVRIAGEQDADAVMEILSREGKELGTRVVRNDQGRLEVKVV